MKIYYHPPQDTSDTAQPPAASGTPYDTVWNSTEVPTQEPPPLEKVMLAEDKLYVVLAVTLVIWLGLLFVLFRTNRRLDRLEKRLPEEEERS